MGVRFGLAILRASLLFGCLATACVSNRFESIATEAAARDACASSTAITIERLSSYAFRSEGCGGQRFYRCWYKRKTMGHTQCCARVDTEERATALVVSDEQHEDDPVCMEVP